MPTKKSLSEVLPLGVWHLAETLGAQSSKRAQKFLLKGGKYLGDDCLLIEAAGPDSICLELVADHQQKTNLVVGGLKSGMDLVEGITATLQKWGMLDEEFKVAAPTSPQFLVNQASLAITNQLKPFLGKVSLEEIIAAFNAIASGKTGEGKLGKDLNELFLSEVKKQLDTLGRREDAYKTPEFQTWFGKQVVTDVIKSLERGEVKDPGQPKMKQKQAASKDKPKWTEDEVKKIGESIGISWDEVSWTPATLLKGMMVELEHGTRHPETNLTDDDPEKTAKIAWAHLMEGASYYSELAKMEKAVKSKEGKEEAAVVKTGAAGASFDVKVRLFSADWWYPDPKQMPLLLEQMKIVFAKLKRSLGGVGSRVVPIKGTNLQGYESVFTFPSLREAKAAARKLEELPFDSFVGIDYDYSITRSASPEFTQFINSIAVKYPEFYRTWNQQAGVGSGSWDDLVESRPSTWMVTLEKWAIYLTLTSLGPDVDLWKLGRWVASIRKRVPRGDILKAYETGNLEVALTKAGLLGRQSDRLRSPADRYY